MFNKLRNRFLLLNLIILSVMMLLSFTTIYLITYNNVHSTINMELRKLSEFNHKPDGSLEQHIRNSDGRTTPGGSGTVLLPENSNNGKHTGDSYNGKPAPGNNIEQPPERSVAFFIMTDTNWNITDYTSRFTTEESFYENAVKIVSGKNKDTGSFSLDEYKWAYLVNRTPEGYRISFQDVTSQHKILRILVYTFLVVALVMLVVIYLISRFFSNRYIKPVKEAFDKQKQFIADASHELKTPLAVINTNADVLLSFGEETVNSQAKWIQYIKSEASRMAKLTNDLLYLTQLDYSDSKMVFSRFNLSDSVENVILTMEGVVFENNLKLKYDMEPDLSINGNSEQISEVVMILLDNAVKYSEAEGFIEISLKKHNNEAVLTVSNTGTGIPEEHLPNIFDRFYRADKSRARKKGGYGLGLSIARAIVEQHNGRIQVKSVVNEKTTFTVDLPIVGGSPLLGGTPKKVD